MSTVKERRKARDRGFGDRSLVMAETGVTVDEYKQEMMPRESEIASSTRDTFYSKAKAVAAQKSDELWQSSAWIRFWELESNFKSEASRRVDEAFSSGLVARQR